MSRSYASLIGSLAAIWGASYRSLRYHGAAGTSLVTYLMPPAALFYGWLLLDEHITTATAAGLVLILGGVALGSGAVALSRRAPTVAEP